jgi:putative SOS response-associated peptidase YedK
MCGRYASSRGATFLADHFEVDEPLEEELAPSWNVAPTDPVAVVLQRGRARALRVARWGLVPSWATDPKVGSRFINARAETVASKPAFRAAYARRRCLVPADGYYEWQTDRGEDGRVRKQPWFLSARDGTPLPMAGLYEVWRPPGDGAPLWTCTVLTTSAPDDVGRLHDRTPLLVPRAEWDRWLDPTREDPGEGLLVPGTPGVLAAWPVTAEVGNVRNDGPQLVQPVPPADQRPDAVRLF